MKKSPLNCIFQCSVFFRVNQALRLRALHRVKFSRLLGDDRGSAIIEFLLYGALLQVSVLMIGTQIIGLQSSQLAVESIARHALRAFVVAGQEPEQTAQSLLRDLGSNKTAVIQLRCHPDCHSDGAVITIKVSLDSAVAEASMVR
jgi:hypothetical protein